uniref:CU044_5270 family protein n=1 Tax=Nonomuraea lactucae TaxID=2249762 RepID=UPI0013B3709B
RVPGVRLLVGGLAAAVALAVVFTLLIGVPAAGPAGARELLLAAAAGSEAERTEGRYTRYETETGDVVEVGTSLRPYKMLARATHATWYPAFSGGDGRQVHRRLGAWPASDEDAAAWRAAGSPVTMPSLCSHGKVHKRGVLVERSGQRCAELDTRPQERATTARTTGDLAAYPRSHPGLDVGELSADPARLREQLLASTRSGGLGGPVEGDAARLWAAVNVALFQPEQPLSPRVRAAAYRIMADLPGVRLLGEVEDARGRKGQAFTRASEESAGVAGTSRIIIDPDSGLPLAQEGYDRPDGALTGYTLVLACGPADSTPAQHVTEARRPQPDAERVPAGR